MRPLVIAVSLSFALGPLAAAPFARAQPSLPPSTSPAPGSSAAGNAPTSYAPQTKDFLAEVSEMGAFQTHLAQMGAKAKSADVRKFAADLSNSRSGGHLLQIGGAAGPSEVSQAHQTLLKDLANSGASFDAKFVAIEVDALKAHLGLVQSYATGGVNGQLREAAAEAVTDTRALLTTAQFLQKPA